MEVALSTICGPDDVITPLNPRHTKWKKQHGIRGKQNYLYPLYRYNRFDLLRAIYHRKRQGFYNHIPAINIKEKVPSVVWNTYFKFCFERNPYDKFISFFYFHNSGQFQQLSEIFESQVMREFSSFEMYTINSILAVNKIYKYEQLDSALEDLSNRLNLNHRLVLPKLKFNSHTRTDKRNYKEVLSPADRRMISIISAREIALLGYKF